MGDTWNQPFGKMCSSVDKLAIAFSRVGCYMDKVTSSVIIIIIYPDLDSAWGSGEGVL